MNDNGHAGRGTGLGAVGVTAVALTALLAVSVVGAAPAVAERSPDAQTRDAQTRDAQAWRGVLRRAWDAAQERRFTGEALSIVWSGGASQVTLSQVRRDHDALTVSSADRVAVGLTGDGGDGIDPRHGWPAPVPADPDGAGADFRMLEHKYDVAVTGGERLLDRPCTRLDVHRRDDASLRERLWVDDDSGLVLRRESFEGADRRVRLVAYLSLDLRPRTVTRPGPRATRGATSVPPPGSGPAVDPLDDAALSALRRAGWTVPPALPGGYRPLGAYAIDGADGQPLQVVYGDGLYTVSLFQQRGRPDWQSLPDGAVPAEGLDGDAYEWPDAVPRRLVWEASGTTFSLVGEAPPEEFEEIAASLPRPQTASLLERLRRGWSRLLSLMPQ